MPRTHTVTLGDHFEDLVNRELNSGRYNNFSEVVRAGLRLLERESQVYEAKLETLRAALREGEESGFVENFDMEKVKAEARERLKRRG